MAYAAGSMAPTAPLAASSTSRPTAAAATSWPT